MKFLSNKSFVPFIIFVVITLFLGIGLTLNPRELPSPFIGKSAPKFELPNLIIEDTIIRNEDFMGQVWLFNVWASWCVACRDEHPLLNELSSTNLVPIVGLNYKDEAQDAKQWLNQFGNPYQQIVTDKLGQTGIEYGVYGVPETFVIDKKGIIRLKHVGPLTKTVLKTTLLPLVKELQADPS